MTGVKMCSSLRESDSSAGSGHSREQEGKVILNQGCFCRFFFQKLLVLLQRWKGVDIPRLGRYHMQNAPWVPLGGS